MKKILAIVLSISMVLGLVGCIAAPQDDGRVSVVVTLAPVYDWTRQILGDVDCDLTLLIDDGVDMHSYQPTADDMIKIADCDLFIYVGGESDSWASDAIAESDVQSICLLDVLGDMAKEEELVEGMEGEEEEGEEDEIEYDEHVWLSLKNASVFVSEIESKLEEILPGSADDLKANSTSYLEQIDALDSAYEEAVANASKDTLVFADRFPFRYLVDDYGINYYAAFAGCSAETEASFETIVFLSGKVDELGLSYVITIDGSDGKIAKTVIENTARQNQTVLVMDSMQSSGTETSYLDVMQSNLDVLITALG